MIDELSLLAIVATCVIFLLSPRLLRRREEPVARRLRDYFNIGRSKAYKPDPVKEGQELYFFLKGFEGDAARYLREQIYTSIEEGRLPREPDQERKMWIMEAIKEICLQLRKEKRWPPEAA